MQLHSTANAEHLLRDPTGNRRFMIFEVDHIQYLYENWTQEEINNWQMQCLAEMKYLASVNYKASKESWDQMNAYIDKQTPTDPSSDLLEQFFAKLKAEISVMEPREFELTDTIITQVIYALTERDGIKISWHKNNAMRKNWSL
jgi:hypothetical protein